MLNVVTADREVSELLVRDPRVDKITFTGSTLAGRKIASILGERIARVNLELGGKSAAVILDDADIATTAATLAGAECLLTGQVCSSLTRIVVTRSRHDELLEALASAFGAKRVGDPFDATSEMGPLVAERQVDRVLGYIDKGKAEGATLATGGGRPKDLGKGYYVEPTVFGNVPNSATIAQEEIFGPVLSVIPADNEAQAIEIANDTIYGLNSSVFTNEWTGPATWPASCGPGPSGTTPSGPTSASRSAGSSSPASAARAAPRACCRSWRPRRSSWTGRPPSTASNARAAGQTGGLSTVMSPGA